MKKNMLTISLYAFIAILAACLLIPGTVCGIVDGILPDGKILKTSVVIINIPLRDAHIMTSISAANSKTCSKSINWLRPVDGGKQLFSVVGIGPEEGILSVNAGGYDQQTAYNIEEATAQGYTFSHCVSSGPQLVLSRIYGEDNKIIGTVTNTVTV